MKPREMRELAGELYREETGMTQRARLMGLDTGQSCLASLFLGVAAEVVERLDALTCRPDRPDRCGWTFEGRNLMEGWEEEVDRHRHTYSRQVDRLRMEVSKGVLDDLWRWSVSAVGDETTPAPVDGYADSYSDAVTAAVDVAGNALRDLYPVTPRTARRPTRRPTGRSGKTSTFVGEERRE